MNPLNGTGPPLPCIHFAPSDMLFTEKLRKAVKGGLIDGAGSRKRRDTVRQCRGQVLSDSPIGDFCKFSDSQGIGNCCSY